MKFRRVQAKKGMQPKRAKGQHWTTRYFILVNSCSCSHMNFVQTVEDKWILSCVLVSPPERGGRALDGFMLAHRNPKPTLLHMECYLNPFEPYFEHSSKWTNLVFQLLNLPSAKKKYWFCGQSTHRIWFWRDNVHYWVLPGKAPGKGLFHQQFLKTIFGFTSMWQLRI